MELLIELIKGVGFQKLKKIETLTDLNDSDHLEATQLLKFYNGIRNGTITNDLQATDQLLHGQKNKSTLRVLKHRLYDRVISTTFFLELPKEEHSIRTLAQLEAARLLVCSRFLIALRIRKVANTFCERALAIAKKFDLTDIALESTRRLLYNALFYNKVKDFNIYISSVENYAGLYNAECISDCIENQSSFLVNTISNASPADIENLGLLLERSANILNDYKSVNIKENHCRIAYRYYYLSKRYKEAISICQDLIAYGNEQPNLISTDVIAEFRFRMLNCYIFIREFALGQECAIECLKTVKEGAFNWYLVHMRYILLCAQTRQYEKAIQLCDTAMHHPKYQNLPEHEIESWKIIEIYMNYTLFSGWVTNHSRKVTWFKKRFNLSDFLKQVPRSVKDKTGSNVAILIAQILFLIEEQDIDAISTRLEALTLYSQRYLNQSNTIRSKYFIKLLMLLEKHSFNYELIAKASEKLYSKLLDASQEKQGASEQAEILPYDHLWPRILQKLKGI